MGRHRMSYRCCLPAEVERTESYVSHASSQLTATPTPQPQLDKSRRKGHGVDAVLALLSLLTAGTTTTPTIQNPPQENSCRLTPNGRPREWQKGVAGFAERAFRQEHSQRGTTERALRLTAWCCGRGEMIERKGGFDRDKRKLFVALGLLGVPWLWFAMLQAERAGWGKSKSKSKSRADGVGLNSRGR